MAELAPTPEPKVVPIEKLPQILQGKRREIRDMMRLRCAAIDSPISPKLAVSAADAVFLLVMVRCMTRAAREKPAFPDADTLANDIARAAESVETCIVVMQEEALETLDGIPKILRAAP